MEVFMLSVQLFVAGYGLNGQDIKYKAQQIDPHKIGDVITKDAMTICMNKGTRLAIITELAHGKNSEFYFKCVMRQGT